MGRTGEVGGETKTEKYDWEIVEEIVEKVVNGESVEWEDGEIAKTCVACILHGPDKGKAKKLFKTCVVNLAGERCFIKRGYNSNWRWETYKYNLVLMVSGKLNGLYSKHSFRRKKYHGIADKWLSEGNHVLNIDNIAFIIAEYNRTQNAITSYVCDNTGSYCIGLLDTWQLGWMVAKHKLIKNIQYMWHPWDTKKDFVYEVYYIIKNNRIVINNERLPEWLVSELVAKKLEES